MIFASLKVLVQVVPEFASLGSKNSISFTPAFPLQVLSLFRLVIVFCSLIDVFRSLVYVEGLES